MNLQFLVDVGWIAEETIIFILNFQNICIQLVKQFENKATNHLIRLFVFQLDYTISWFFFFNGVSFKVLMKSALNVGWFFC